jgi:3'(2'), 5'-bisphosphate nucleotidase
MTLDDLYEHIAKRGKWKLVDIGGDYNGENACQIYASWSMMQNVKEGTLKQDYYGMLPRVGKINKYFLMPAIDKGYAMSYAKMCRLPTPLYQIPDDPLELMKLCLRHERSCHVREMEYIADKIEEVARKAGKKIMTIYRRDFSVEYKDDKSPLTEADLAANKIICRDLKKYFKQEHNYEIPIVSEENKAVPHGERKFRNMVLVVDPIDGTKEFIKKNGEFTVNIALLFDNQPAIGIVYAPAIDYMVRGVALGGIMVNGRPFHSEMSQDTVVMGSRSHRDNAKMSSFLEKLGDHQMVAKGSSLKLLDVALGHASHYPRFGPTSEWDTCAAHAILKSAGCIVHKLGSREEIQYNKEDILNPEFVCHHKDITCPECETKE